MILEPYDVNGERVQDGLIYSEYSLSKLNESELMTQENDILDLFTKNTGDLMEGITHATDQSVVDKTIVDE